MVKKLRNLTTESPTAKARAKLMDPAPAMAMAGAGAASGGTFTGTVNLYTSGLSRHDLEAAGETLVTIINTQLRRVGRKI